MADRDGEPAASRSGRAFAVTGGTTNPVLPSGFRTFPGDLFLARRCLPVFRPARACARSDDLDFCRRACFLRRLFSGTHRDDSDAPVKKPGTGDAGRLHARLWPVDGAQPAGLRQPIRHRSLHRPLPGARHREPDHARSIPFTNRREPAHLSLEGDGADRRADQEALRIPRRHPGGTAFFPHAPASLQRQADKRLPMVPAAHVDFRAGWHGGFRTGRLQSRCQRPAHPLRAADDFLRPVAGADHVEPP